MVDGSGVVIDLPRPSCDTCHMQAPHDFSEECSVIAALLSNLSYADFDRETAFKAWTIGDIVEHLHLFNIAADASLGGRQSVCSVLRPDPARHGERAPRIAARLVWRHIGLGNLSRVAGSLPRHGGSLYDSGSWHKREMVRA